MKTLLILSLILNLFITGCSSHEDSEIISKETRIEQLIQKKKYAEAKVLVEEVLVQDPYNIDATKQHKFLRTKVPEKKEWMWVKENNKHNEKKP